MKSYDLDHAATTKIHPLVFEAMLPYLNESYGNPSSLHDLGMINKRAVQTSRKNIAAYLGCDANELIFTASGTEATNLAIKGYALKHPGKKEIITTTIEHSATLKTVEFLETQGYIVHQIPVNSEGFIDLKTLENKLNNQTLMVSIIWGNNEIGVIQDIETIGHLVHQKGCILHVDAVQILAHFPINLSTLPVDLMSLSAHKIEGPKGIGLLFKKSTIEIEPIIHGGGQEMHHRSGTESVASIVGFEKAFSILHSTYETKQASLHTLANTFYTYLSQWLPCVKLGPVSQERRIPGLLCLSIPNIKGLKFQFKLNQKGIYISTGSACHTNEVGVSHVIEAIQAPYPDGIIRISFGLDTTLSELEALNEQFKDAYESL